MTDNIHGLRADTWEWTVWVNDKFLGVFDEKDGGEVDSDDQIFKPGGMADPYSLGGTPTTGNLTLRRNYRLSRDHPRSQELINAVGSGKVKATGQPLDRTNANHAWGDPFTYIGTLKTVTFPSHDSRSNEPSMIELVITITGKPTGM